MKHKILTIILFVFAVVGLIACTSAPEEIVVPSPTITSKLTPSPTAPLESTQTPVPTATSTPMPSPTLTPTPTSTPNPTPTEAPLTEIEVVECHAYNERIQLVFQPMEGVEFATKRSFQDLLTIPTYPMTIL